LWQQQFGTRIPVVEIDGATICEGRLDADALERALLDAISGRGSHHS
jgi:2C-methyl-D-erythritol 2,4-cyclodiphosphate synthase